MLKHCSLECEQNYILPHKIMLRPWPAAQLQQALVPLKNVATSPRWIVLHVHELPRTRTCGALPAALPAYVKQGRARSAAQSLLLPPSCRFVLRAVRVPRLCFCPYHCTNALAALSSLSSNRTRVPPCSCRAAEPGWSDVLSKMRFACNRGEHAN